MIKINRWNEKEWDSFVDKSPQGSVFCKGFFLKSYNQPVRYLKCLQGKETVAAFAFIESPSGIKSMPYQAYGGIIFKDLSNLKNYRRNLITFNALQSFAEYLFSHYRNIEIANSWDIIDMRPFDWVNYHQREKGYYKIFIRYTSLLDISKPKDISGYARLRVRDLKKNNDTRFLTKESDDIELLSFLHEATFKKQGIKRTKKQAKTVMNICKNLLQAKAGVLLVTRVKGEPAIASFFIYDRFRAYHLFVGTNISFKNLGGGTKNLYDSFNYLNKKLSLKELDMLGINSPNRGAYKLSYGGRIVPCYQITKVLAK